MYLEVLFCVRYSELIQVGKIVVIDRDFKVVSCIGCLVQLVRDKEVVKVFCDWVESLCFLQVIGNSKQGEIDQRDWKY